MKKLVKTISAGNSSSIEEKPVPSARKKCVGRPKKGSDPESRKRILNAAVRVIRKYGAQALTVRKVCAEAGVSTGTFYYHFHDKDDMMMAFIREDSFDSFTLTTPLNDIAGRTAELYMVLVGKYIAFGKDFMKNFYTAWNKALASYMGENNGAFEEGTVMARNEKELQAAQDAGILNQKTDIHRLAADICTIVKGCVFEWCLSDGKMDIEHCMPRILSSFLKDYQ